MSKKNIIHTNEIKLPLGTMIVGATPRGICLLEFDIPERLDMQFKRLEKLFSASISHGKSPFFAQLSRELSEYFANRRTAFSVPLDIKGTKFQKSVWQTLLEIPYGTTVSYQEQAIAMGNPKAVRAVASANRANRIGILIPCHRVIGKNGSMTGYGGEIWRKEYLLTLEKASDLLP